MAVVQKGNGGGRYVVRVSKTTGKHYKVYEAACKGSPAKNSAGRKRVVHVGPQGGQYCVVNGRKQYLVDSRPARRSPGRSPRRKSPSRN
jgi:hypothetical protein